MTWVRRIPREREPEVLRLYESHGRNAAATARALGVSQQTVLRICWRHRIFDGGQPGFGAHGVPQPSREALRRAAARRWGRREETT